MLYLKKVNLEDIDEEYRAIKQIPANENGFTNKYHNVTRDEFREQVIPMLLKKSEGIDLPDDRVPQTYFFLWNDNKIVGLFKIRHCLNESLRNGAGHIGYGILPEYRLKGFAKQGLLLAIEKCREIIKEDEIYLSVHKDNLVSLKVQLSCGAYIVGETKEEYLTRIKLNDINRKKVLSPRLETERLILRRYRESDLDAIYEMIGDSRLQKYISFPKISRDEELETIRNWINEADESKYEKWVITLKNTNEVVGNISVNRINKKNNYCEIGYTVRYEYWGNGYASEALKEVSNYLLNSGYYLVEGVINENNIQSKRVLEKAGFIKDGYVANRRLNSDETYSGIEFYSRSGSK